MEEFVREEASVSTMAERAAESSAPASAITTSPTEAASEEPEGVDAGDVEAVDDEAVDADVTPPASPRELTQEELAAEAAEAQRIDDAWRAAESRDISG